MAFEAAAATVEAAIAAGAFPGAVVLVAHHGRVVWHQAFGARRTDPSPEPMAPDAVFDLSSLTKALATTTMVMLLVRDGRLRLEDRVSRFLPNFSVQGKAGITIRHLLAHCSGLAPWRPFFRDIVRIDRAGRPNFAGSTAAKAMVFEQIHRATLEYLTGTRTAYSDLGFILLGELVELVAHGSLDRVCHERIFRPLGLRSMAFIDLSLVRLKRLVPRTDAIAPTERCPWRRTVLCGEVHDDNAWAMGGVAGHAGLFADASDVHALVARLFACWRGEDDFVPPDLVREFWTRDATVEGSTWALGWDTPAPRGSSAGARVSSRAVGHLGFTGTSIWVDLERDAHVVLLTNRVHPRRDNERIREVRPRVHDAVWEELDR